MYVGMLVDAKIYTSASGHGKDFPGDNQISC